MTAMLGYHQQQGAFKIGVLLDMLEEQGGEAEQYNDPGGLRAPPEVAFAMLFAIL